MNFEALLSKTECTTIEFKENMNPQDRIIETVIAFANTAGGHLIIGVSNSKALIGVEDPLMVSEALASRIHDVIYPRILPNIETITYMNKYFVCAEIYPSTLRPHFKKSVGKEKSTYIRLGATTRLADQDLLRAIERSTNTLPYDEEPNYEMSYEDLDLTAASQLLQKDSQLTLDNFISLGLITKIGHDVYPTNAGVILFGKQRLRRFPHAWIQLGAFGGTDKTTIVDQKDIEGFFWDKISEVIDFIKRHIQVGLTIETLQHTENWEIPPIALREAIMNAIVHTDYSLPGAPIRIAIFHDRVEIENTAILPWGLTFEDLKSGISKLRNPTIARVFHKIGYIEQWGSGIKRMMRACEEAGLEQPCFEEIGPRIRVTFFRRKIAPILLKDNDRIIVGVLSFCGSLSTQQITSCLNISKRSVIDRLTALKERGVIVELSQNPTDPTKKYTLTERHRIKKIHFYREIQWVFAEKDPLGEAHLRLGIDNHEINFIFLRKTVKDYFSDEGNLDVVKSLFLSKPEFEAIFLQAFSHEMTKAAFQKKEIMQWKVEPQDFHFKDFRKDVGSVSV